MNSSEPRARPQLERDVLVEASRKIHFGTQLLLYVDCHSIETT